MTTPRFGRLVRLVTNLGEERLREIHDMGDVWDDARLARASDGQLRDLSYRLARDRSGSPDTASRRDAVTDEIRWRGRRTERAPSTGSSSSGSAGKLPRGTGGGARGSRMGRKLPRGTGRRDR